MYAIIAFIPIILTIVLMIGFNWSAKRALMLAWALTAVFAIALWKMSILHAFAYTITGFLSAIETLVIIFGAILIMNTLVWAIDKKTHPRKFGYQLDKAKKEAQ